MVCFFAYRHSLDHGAGLSWTHSFRRHLCLLTLQFTSSEHSPELHRSTSNPYSASLLDHLRETVCLNLTRIFPQNSPSPSFPGSLLLCPPSISSTRILESFRAFPSLSHSTFHPQTIPLPLRNLSKSPGLAALASGHHYF